MFKMIGKAPQLLIFGTPDKPCDSTNVDMWLTGASNAHYYIIETGINIETTLSYIWTVPDTQLEDSYVFRFIPSGVKWESGGQEISSNIFGIEAHPNLSSSVANSSPTTTTTTTTPSSNTPTSNTPTGAKMPSDSITSTATTHEATTESMSPTVPTNTSEPAGDSSGSSRDSLSTGAAAGIGVGATFGGLALVALGFCLAWRWRRDLATVAPNTEMTPQSQPREPARYEQEPPVHPNGGPTQQSQWDQHVSGYNGSNRDPEVAELSEQWGQARRSYLGFSPTWPNATKNVGVNRSS
ncbi:hypothetical protein GQX73_g1744 [Xylaria multiplex]|uniref:Uncharacterized protein n=1 Tax=Xylaria multiplex TaxID=323545 RepID=A0A7C8ITH3_9PEZI|nr:hypothetical protein GQX73_g1744 [Xylaria multiplex]